MAGTTASTSTVRLDTKQFCIFCLKRDDRFFTRTEVTVKQEKQEGDSGCEKKVSIDTLEVEVRIRRQFSRVISRYLGTNFAFLSTSTSPHDDVVVEKENIFLNKRFEVVPDVDISFICTDCLYLVEKISSLFHTMTQLEMELDWKTRQLRRIMAFAKRAPTRVNLFRKQFSDSGCSSDMEELHRIERFRKELLDKSSAKFRSIPPRIIFKRKGDPLSSPGSRRKSAKRTVKKVITVDTEVQTEPFTEVSQIFKPPGSAASKAGESISSSIKDSKVPDNTPSFEESNTVSDDDNNCFSAPASPSSVNLNSDVEEVNSIDDDNSAGIIRIRNIESLISPTKSVNADSPVKKTRTTSRIPVLNSTTVETSNVAGEPASKQTQQKSLEKGNSALFSAKPNSIVRKATLAEWLQSTFNCNKCNKMFISEATLNVHKSTCGINTTKKTPETETTQETAMETDESSEPDVEEIPIDITTAEGDISSEEDDPLGESTSPSKETEEDEKSSEASKTTTTCTIRIIKGQSTPQETKQPGTRYCKYCVTRISIKHFNRHRETAKHKQNKRVHKKAKKLGTMSNANGPALPAAGTVLQTTSAVSAVAASATGATTASQNTGENVRVVKIIYVTGKNSTATSSDQPKEGGTEESKDGQNGKETTPTVASNSSTTDNGNNVVIDISED